MTIRECIDKVDNLKPNQYTTADKVDWLSRLDYNIVTDIYDTHHYNEGEEEVTFTPYTTEDMDKQLIVPFPYDELYVAYIEMKIDAENKEATRYNGSVTFYNAYYDNFAKHYNKTHLPIRSKGFRIWR